MNKDEAVEILIKHIDSNYKTRSQFAKDIGVSDAYVSQQLNGKGPLSDTMLKAVGLKRVVTDSYMKCV